MWNAFIASLPNPHLLQTLEWGQVKQRYGWSPLYALWTERRFLVQPRAEHWALGDEAVVAACLILKKPLLRRVLAARLTLLYAPRGPLLDWSNEPLRRRVLDDLQAFARQQGAIFLKIDPEVALGLGPPPAPEAVEHENGRAVMSELIRRGWRYSAEQIQFKNSVLIDLSVSEEELLARMKQKTRYNLRLAQKKGVVIRTGTPADFSWLYKMYAETSLRDGFVIREEDYYRTVWRTFTRPSSNHAVPSAVPLIAEVQGQPVAGLFLFMFAQRAYYLYGMSREVHREKMPNYLLQWEAMRRARAAGCKLYDLWGAPDEFQPSDPLWGVYRFKEGLGGQVVRTLGAWDYVPQRLWYRLYSEVVPRMLEAMRTRGRARTQQKLERGAGI